MKPHIVIIGKHQALSAAVQEQLFKRHAGWSGGAVFNDLPAQWEREGGGFIRVEKDGRMWTGATADIHDERPELDCFDAATQFGEWLGWLDEPEKPKWPQTIQINFGNSIEVHYDGSATLYGDRGTTAALSKVHIDALHAASQAARSK